jgi:protein-S-isoprenylcysteine O-methyltransferase Ste14
MYLGMLLVLTGTALLVRAPAALLMVPLFLWWMTARFIAHEERALHAQFGEEYRAYTARVRRWL